MAQRRRPQGRGRDQSGDRQGAGASAACQHGRSRRGARRRREGLRRSGARPRPMTAPRSCARPPIWCASAPITYRAVMTQEQGKVSPKARGEVLDHRRHHRMVSPRKAAAPMAASCRAAQKGVRQTRGAGAGRRGRGVHAVEFPDADAGAQDRRRARGRLLDHPQGLGGDAGRLRRAGALLRRCRPAGGRAQSRVRRAGRSVRASDRVRRSCARFRSPARSRSASISPASPPRA